MTLKPEAPVYPVTRPSSALRITAGSPGSSFAAERRANLARVVARVRSHGRTPRVCLYALATAGQAPRHSFDKAQAFAVRQGWQTGSEQRFCDHQGAGSLETRPGWCCVRRQILAGYADGVVVITTDAISVSGEELRRELEWFEHRGFVAVVAPEAGRAWA